jgi:hypothetical protein
VGLSHEDVETGLGEVVVVGQGFPDVSFSHHLETGAIDEAPFLVGSGVVETDGVPESDVR